uniref:Uncharacterized protein n=1 Tax=Anopheles merus TaxID=30066 RepID=A0A182V5N1_ANOME
MCRSNRSTSSSSLSRSPASSTKMRDATVGMVCRRSFLPPNGDTMLEATTGGTFLPPWPLKRAARFLSCSSPVRRRVLAASLDVSKRALVLGQPAQLAALVVGRPHAQHAAAKIRQQQRLLVALAVHARHRLHRATKLFKLCGQSSVGLWNGSGFFGGPTFGGVGACGCGASPMPAPGPTPPGMAPPGTAGSGGGGLLRSGGDVTKLAPALLPAGDTGSEPAGISGGMLAVGLSTPFMKIHKAATADESEK